MTHLNIYPRETIEFQEVTVTLDGTPITTFQTCIAASGVRPTTWVAAYELDSKHGVLITSLTPGHYRIWAKVTDSPEIPVIDCGPVHIT